MYQELENKALAEFEEKFVEDRGRYVEPIFKDAVGSVGPIKNFLKSHLKEAYEAGVDKTIERFATGELLKSDDAQKFYDLAYEAGQEEKKKIPTIRKWHDSLDSLIDDVKKEERERIIKWAEKYMDKTTKYYGTDKHGIALDDLIQELQNNKYDK